MILIMVVVMTVIMTDIMAVAVLMMMLHKLHGGQSSNAGRTTALQHPVSQKATFPRSPQLCIF